MSVLPGARADLLELDAAALTALANAGFVKRAIKEVDEGRAPTVSEDADGTVHAVFDDGQRTRLPPGRPLREAACSCPASGMCRHRVTLVVAYQRAVGAARDGETVEPGFEPWSPADFDDAALAATLAPATLAMARQAAHDHPVVRLDPARAGQPTPTVRLPTSTVRFYSRHNLQLARCDCREATACAHVALGVWAFRQARAQGREQAGASFELVLPQAAASASTQVDTAAADAAREAIEVLLRQLWLDGSSQPEAALANPLATARARAEALGWRWIVDALDDLARSLEAQRQRSSRFDPRHLLALAAELPARLAAARTAEAAGAATVVPARQILGLGVRGETALDHVRLVALGLLCWRDDAGDGAQVVFADPDTQRLMVLERAWQVPAEGATVAALPHRRVAGQALGVLARSQVVTQAAKRRANGSLEIATGVRHTSVLPLAPETWRNLGPPLRQPDAATLVASLRTALPAFVQPRQAIEDLVVLPVAAVLGWGWDAAAQALRAQVVCAAEGALPAVADDGDEDESDGEDGDDGGAMALLAGQAANLVQWTLPHHVAAPGAVDALARVLAGEHGAVQAVAGIARLAAGALQLEPTLVFCRNAVVAPQAADAAQRALPAWKAAASGSARATALAAAREWLVAALRQGLRHQSGDVAGRVESTAAGLDRACLAHAAGMLRGIARDLRSPDRRRLPGRLASLALLVEAIDREPEEPATTA